MSLKITGTGRGLPQRIVLNRDLEEFLDTSDKWIRERTGIEERRICVQESLTDLAYEASIKALEAAGKKACDIDYIICSTIGGDYITPSLACSLGQRLGVVCPAFDLNAACTGFIYALDLAQSLLNDKKASSVLVVGAERMSAFTDWTDRSTSVLFGDGAGACLCEPGSALKFLYTDSKGDVDILYSRTGSGNSPFAKDVSEKGYLHMTGQEVFKFAVKSFEKHVELATKALEIETDDIDLYLLHQANKRIIDFAGQRLGLDAKKFPINLTRYGNISSASIPLLMDELVRDGKIKKGDKIFCSAFGAGLTSGSCVLEWE